MQIVCGFDVHKDSVFVCIPNDNGDKFEAQYDVLTLVEIKNYTSVNFCRSCQDVHTLLISQECNAD